MKLFSATLIAGTMLAAPVAPAFAADLSTMQLALSDGQKAQVFTLAPAAETYQLAGGMITSGAPARRAAAGDKNPWIAAVLNFFLMGAGYVYNGEDVPKGLGLTLASLGLTYVEMGTLQPRAMATGAPTSDVLPFAVMFGSVFLANTFLAIDGYREAEAINAR